MLKCSLFVAKFLVNLSQLLIFPTQSLKMACAGHLGGEKAGEMLLWPNTRLPASFLRQSRPSPDVGSGPSHGRSPNHVFP